VRPEKFTLMEPRILRVHMTLTIVFAYVERTSVPHRLDKTWTKWHKMTRISTDPDNKAERLLRNQSSEKPIKVRVNRIVKMY
jgi:hypothetical protein